MKNTTRSLFAISLAMIFAVADSQNRYQFFQPSNGILKGSTSTYVTQSATAADLIGLLTGSCSPSVFVEGDGACAKVNLTSQVVGTLPLANGGIGATSLAAATIPVFSGSIVTGDCVKWLSATSIGDAGAACGSGGGGSGSVNSVALSDGSTVPIYSISGSPITNTGTLTFTLSNESPHFGLFGPASGVSSAQPTFRALVSADVPAANLASSANGGVTGLLPNANLANSSIIINGTSVSLGSTRTLALASADFASQGTGTTVLHGNAGGNPNFGAVNLATDITSILPVANGGSGTATPGLIQGTNITITGSWPNQTIAASGGGGGCSLANPTGTIGLTAVNGIAVTCLRSDSAPALSQAIAPTWTGTHLFNGGIINSVTAAGVNIGQSAGAPVFRMVDTNGALNTKAWQMSTNLPGTVFSLQAASDDWSTTFTNALTISRSAAAIANLSFGNPTDNPTYNFNGTGSATFSGPVAANSSTGVALTVNGNSGNTAQDIFPASGTTGLAIVAVSGQSAAIALRGNANAGSAAGVVSQDGSSNVHVSNLGAAAIDFDTNGVNHASIDSNGQVVLNAATGTTLTVNDASAAPMTVNGANAATGAALQIVGAFTGTGTTNLVSINDPNNTNGVNLKLVGNGATTPAKTIRVAGGTFQLLNSAYSTSLLSIADNGNETLSSNGANQIAFLSAPSTFTSQLFVGANGNAQSASMLMQQDISHNGYIRNQDSGSLFLGTGSTNFWNINAAGTLSNGTVPTSGETLNIASGSAASGITVDSNPFGWTTHGSIDLGTTGGIEADSGTTTWVNNGYFASPNWTYKTTAAASFARQDSSGNVLFETAPSGTAGTSIAGLVNRLEVNNDGGVTVGSAADKGAGTFDAPVIYQAGTALANSAVVDATNAINITAGTLALARLPTQTGTGSIVLSASPALTGSPTVGGAFICLQSGTNCPAFGSVTSITAGTGLSGGTITTSGTISLSTPVAVTNGGEGLSTAALGDIRYGSAANTIAALAGNTTATKKFLTQTGTGTVSAAPAWGTVAVADVNGFGTGIGTFLATPTSANLAAAITDETGTGAAVFATSPTLVTPAIKGSSTGVTTVASANASATNYTATLPANTGTLPELNLAQSWTALQSFPASDISIAGTTVTGVTGTGSAVLATSPTITTPTVSGNLTTNITGSAQCVQANSAGVLSGTGSGCGSGAGTVTSITAGTGLTGGTITSSGTIALLTPVSAALGGSGEAGTLTGIVYANGASAHTVATTAQVASALSGGSIPAPGSGASITVNGANVSNAFTFNSGQTATGTGDDLVVNRAGSTANNVGQGPNIGLFDTTNTKETLIQNSGGQTEFWQFNSSWAQAMRIGTTDGLVVGGAAGGDKGAGTVNAAGTIYQNNTAVCLSNGTNCPSGLSTKIAYANVSALCVITSAANVSCGSHTGGTGVYSLTVSGASFSATPACTTTVGNSATNVSINYLLSSSSSTSVSFEVFVGAVGTDEPFSIICMGT